jgi:hypothetical protein
MGGAAELRMMRSTNINVQVLLRLSALPGE